MGRWFYSQIMNELDEVWLQMMSQAQAQAQAATRWIPGAVVITEVEVSNRKLYRARLVGLQENQARTACQSLSRQKMECFVIRSQS